MRRYAVWLVLLSMIALLGFVVVTTTFQPIDSLMRPPKVEGENLDIQLAFEEKVGTNYILKRPMKGSHKSAYTFIDLTGDKNNEVIVFYSKADNLGIVRMNVLINTDGQWKSIADFQSVHNDIQEVDFADLNGDGNKEIIVGWTVLQDSNSKLLSVYEISRDVDTGRIYPIYSEYYSMFKVVDIDNNNVDDILSIKYSAAAGSAEYKASFLSYEENGINEINSFVLDKTLTSIGAISCDFIHDNTCTRIFVDGYKADSGMLTDCIIWNNRENSFERYLVSGESVSSLTSRTSTVFCKDINSDGYIEIPTEEHLPAIKYDDPSNNNLGTHLIVWLLIDNYKSEYVESHIVLSQYGYSFRFKQSWIGNVSVENDSQKKLLTFWSLKYIDGVVLKDKELFSIMTLTDFDLDVISEMSFNYTLIEQGVDKYYYCRVYDEGEEYGITKKDIKNRIISG